MHSFARLPKKDLTDAFLITAQKRKIHPAIIEKDFWVCWMLDYLFQKSIYRDYFAFKGGTSLSKCFNLIERFSEDIDLIIDWSLLGYQVNEPWEKRSNTKQDAFNLRINKDSVLFLQNKLIPEIQHYLDQQQISDATLFLDYRDPQTLRFFYPKTFSDNSILQEIRLEAGALAAWTPTTIISISPYISEEFPDVFLGSTTLVRAVLPERTFWEKATILHKEAFRTNGRFPQRYSRHYYDLYKLANSSVKKSALNNLDLLKKVVDFKMKFWRLRTMRCDGIYSTLCR